MNEGRWLKEAADLAGRLPYRLSLGAARSWRAPAEYDRFQSEYIRLFDVGPRGTAPCPLYGGHYTRDRLRTMEELIRFYNFFGLRLTPGLMPDHITVELEFMHYLAFKEGEPGEDTASYRRAQRDFIDRQLANWLPRLAASLRGQRPLPFYRSLTALVSRFLAADRAHLRGVLSGS